MNPVPLAAWRHAPLGRKRPCFAVLFPTLSVAPAGRESGALAAAALSPPSAQGTMAQSPPVRLTGKTPAASAAGNDLPW